MTHTVDSGVTQSMPAERQPMVPRKFAGADEVTGALLLNSASKIMLANAGDVVPGLVALMRSRTWPGS